nr:histone H1-I-like [Ipomoea batatas]
MLFRNIVTYFMHFTFIISVKKFSMRKLVTFLSYPRERGKEERLQAQETRAAISRRDVMGIAAAGLGISLAKRAEAVEVANSGNPISQFLDLLKGLVGTPEPKPEGDEPKTESKPELPKPKTVGDEEPPVDNKAEPSNPKTEGEVKAETEAVGEN